jgi:signal transduction histidine kinase
MAYQAELQSLSASLIEARESGNRELARELHDAVSQKLAVLRIEVSTLLQSLAKRIPAPVLGRLEALGQAIGALAEDVHRMSRHLHPAVLEDLGLEAALRAEFEVLSQQSGIPVDFTAASLPPAIPKDMALCIYRVTQEALNNISKYANARDVTASLTGDKDGITLLIEDRGNGFDVEAVKRKGSLGLISMEERVRVVNGKFSIDSKPGVGTSISVWVPSGEEPK